MYSLTTEERVLGTASTTKSTPERSDLPKARHDCLKAEGFLFSRWQR